MARDGGLLNLLTSLCWVLLLVCCPSLTGAESRPPTAHRRALLELGSHKPQVIRAELIHRNHPDSRLTLPRETTGSFADLYHATAAEKTRIARRLRAGVEFTTPISFVPEVYGLVEYTMALYLGTPAQKFVVIVDTGSDLVWVQCQPCIKCYNETDPLFDPSASSSYSAVPCSDNSTCDPSQFPDATCDARSNCHISYEYLATGSFYTGVLSTETITFSNSTDGQLGISKFVFGCMNNNTASFGTADGIVGFGRGPLSLPSQLSKLTSLDVFAYCLVPRVASANLTSPLSFGASNPNGLQLVYTPILDIPDVPSVYWVNMTGISINGTAVSIPRAPLEFNPTTGGGTLFDSGSIWLVLHPKIYTPVVQRFQSLITYPSVPNNSSLFCFNTSGVQQPEYPSMTLHFSGVNDTVVDFPLAAENLYFPGSNDGTVQCLAIPNYPINLNIVGNIAQANHYIETDLMNQRIGWASKDCTLPM